MNDLPKSSISPFAVADRLRAAANLTEPALAEQISAEPRLVEVVWAIQKASSQPGGLDKFARELIQQFAPHFGPAIVHDESAPLTLEQREQIWKDISRTVEDELIPFRSWATEKEPDDADDHAFCRSVGLYPEPRDPTERKRFQAALMKLPRAKFRDVFIDAAKDFLSEHLRSLCVGEGKDSYRRSMGLGDKMDLTPWWGERLVDVLFEALDAHAARVELGLARTKVVTDVFDCLNYCWSQKGLARITGDSRTGKTEAVKAWVEANPGKARLVSVPSGRSVRDLIVAIAGAIGVPSTAKTKTPELKNHVQYILHHGRLMLVLDEAHNLVPINPGRDAQPARLDWLRSQVIDKDIPVALVTTPQFKRCLDKFQQRTDYQAEQFEGRIMPDIILDKDLSEDDWLSVVKFHGHGIPEAEHRFILARAKQSVGRLKAIEGICQYARYAAQRDNGRRVTRADVQLAASKVPLLAIATAQTEKPPARPPAPRNQPIAAKRSRPIRPLAATEPALQGPARHNSPAPALEMQARGLAPSLTH